MKNAWLSKRQNVFIRDLVDDFIASKQYFDKILNVYDQQEQLPYKHIEEWVGSENSKGPLWNIKDLSHRLFRNSGTSRNLYEHLFDWSIGSIFHESIKLKEDVYQVNAYKPLLDHAVENYSHDPKVSRLISENFSLMEKVSKDVKKELTNIAGLFEKAVGYLLEIFIVHRDNELLVKYLLDHKALLDNVYSPDVQNRIFNKMFPDGTRGAFLFVSAKMKENGWQDISEKYQKKADKYRITDK